MGPPMADFGDTLPASAEESFRRVPLCRVQNQKLCLAVDLKAQTLEGYTELDVFSPPADAPRILGLHANGLQISRIFVEGAPAKFQQLAPPAGQTRVRSLQQVYAATKEDNPNNAGEKVYRDYVRLLQEESEPELLIHLPEVLQEAGASHEPIVGVTSDGFGANGAQVEATGGPGREGHPNGGVENGADLKGVENGAVGIGQTGETKEKGHEREAGTAENGLALVEGSGGRRTEPVEVEKGDEGKEEPSGKETGTPEKGTPEKGTPEKGEPSGGRNRSDEKEKKGSARKGSAKDGKEIEAKDETSTTLLRVRIGFRVKHARAGVNFQGDVMHTNNQLRRARCWFPCADTSEHPHSFDLEYTVDAQLMAISSGELLYQAFTSAAEQRKVWAYRVAAPTTPGLISLAVGPFVVLPDVQAPAITHVCMPGHLKKLRQTVHFLHTAFSTYEEYLDLPFPFSSYVQVFLDSEAAYETATMGLSTALLSAHLLVDDRIIDQTSATRIKLASLLARQWFGAFITADSSADVWLIDGLAALLTDVFVRRHLGNNELRYRRYKEYEAVCLADVDGAAPLSIPDLDESEKAAGPAVQLEELERSSVRTWKAKAVLAMLEKQVGPDGFKKCIQELVTQARDGRRPGRAVTTRDFQAILRKVGGQDKRALKEFFARWVKSPGCPRISVAFNYIRRRNLLEVALVRTATASADPAVLAASSGAKSSDLSDINPESGWPGSLPIRVQELDGSFDHLVALSGDPFDKAELQCHSKLTAAKKLIAKEGKPTKRKGKYGQKKKGAPAEIEEDGELGGPLKVLAGAANGAREHNVDSAVVWVRVNPDLDVLAELHVHQTEHMWIAQLEKDRDVVAQVEAITALGALPRPTFAAMNALNNCLADGRVYCHVRAEAARALGRTAKESTNWAGLDMLLKFYRSRRYDPDVEQPKPNDFSDFRDYFVDQAIPGAVASVRGSDGFSPLEAVEFLLEVLKYNDNSANAFSDGNWLAVVIEAVGAAKYSPQTRTQHLPKLLKQLDKHLQYDRLLPSHGHVVTISCLRTLARLACQMPRDETLKERLQVLLLQHTSARHVYKVRVAAFRSLMDLEHRWDGPTAALHVALKVADNREPAKEDSAQSATSKILARTDRGFGAPFCAVVTKLLTYASRLWASHKGVATPEGGAVAGGGRLQGLVTSRRGWRDVRLRHVAFMLDQQMHGRPATLFRMYTTHGIDLPQPEAPPSEAQAAAPPSGKEEGHVPLLVRIRRAGSESVAEPTKTDGTKIFVRLPRPGGMAAPSATQDSLKVRLKLSHGPLRSSQLGPDASEGAGTSVRQAVERPEATERSSQPEAGPGHMDEAHQEASTPLRSASVEGEPGEGGPPRPHIELPRPGARKFRSATARVPRTLSLVPIANLVETEAGGPSEGEGAPPDTEDGSMEVLEVPAMAVQSEGKLRELSSEGVPGDAALAELAAKEAAMRERMAQIEAMLAAENGNDSRGVAEVGEERNEPKEEGEIEEEEGEIRAAKGSGDGEKVLQKKSEGEGVPAKREGEQKRTEAQGERGARVHKGDEKERLKKQKKGKGKKKGDKKRGEGVENKGLKQGEGGTVPETKAEGRVETVVLEPSEEGEIKSPKGLGDEVAAQKRSKDAPGRVLTIADEEEEGEVRVEGESRLPVRKDVERSFKGPRLKEKKGAPVEGPELGEGTGAPIVPVKITGQVEGGKKKSGLKLSLGKGALSEKDVERLKMVRGLVPLRKDIGKFVEGPKPREEKGAPTALVKGTGQAEGVKKKSGLKLNLEKGAILKTVNEGQGPDATPVKREKAADIGVIAVTPKAELLPTKEAPAKAPGFKLKLKLKGVVVGDKGPPGKGVTPTESARPSPGVDSQGRLWKGVKTETEQPPAEAQTPSARKGPESSDDEKRRDKLKGMSDEEYQRMKAAKKEDKRRRKEERRRRKSLGAGEAEAAARGAAENEERASLNKKKSTAEDVRKSEERAAEDERPGATGGDVTADGLRASELQAGGETPRVRVKREAEARAGEEGAAGTERGEHVADAGVLASTTGGSVLGKRGRDGGVGSGSHFGKLTSDIDELEAEIGDVIPSPAKEERKRRRMREGSAGGGTGAEVGFANVGERVLGDLDDLEGPQARGLGSPDEAEKKKQERLRRVKEMLGKKRGAGGVEMEARIGGEEGRAKEKMGKGNSGGPMEARGGAAETAFGFSREWKVREAKGASGKSQGEKNESTEGGGLRDGQWEDDAEKRAKVSGDKREKISAAELKAGAQPREAPQIDRIRIKKERGTEERLKRVKDERGGEVLTLDGDRGTKGASLEGARGLEDQAEPIDTGQYGAEGVEKEGEKREGERKRKKNRDEKRGSKPKKRMKSLDALLEEEASRPKPEVEMGPVKMEAGQEYSSADQWQH
ncbi:TATA binding protein associated factor [Klebsormidium nitens]|uniref:Transcription initiation factor TFIID subunit 2 n=1 Tax=Klebsormidium nitens TaxID=105231 RepID=A0A1Y1IFP3_KLENI|nr:TATA binding protein associated factor [Klebsormidium nitens]|eukprot:GAQ89684.1 TATA binding protein associated factor [Klebsormidium nitens]